VKLPSSLVLASGSPRRREFLEMLGLPFTAHIADIDEAPLPEESPVDLVLRLSQAKAQAVATYHPEALIIAADTIVVLDNQILGKPVDEADARQMLNQLKGRDHAVYSAVALWHDRTGRQSTHLSQTTVTMRDYTKTEIETYIASGDPMDKAGAYAIQHPEFAPVAKICGCYAGVVGLPLGHLAEGLAQFGITIDHLGQQCASYTGESCCLLTSTR